MAKLKDNKTLIMIIGAAAIVLIAVGIIFTIGKGTNKVIDADEKEIIERTNVSKEDAINIIKGIFNGDTYEYKCDVTEDKFYRVIVTNTLIGNIHVYYVDPTTKTYIAG